jgi:Ca-activated chloride channel family protein
MGNEPRQANTIGKYRLVAELGHGGMADVYLGVAAGVGGFNKLIVVKLLRDLDDPEQIQMFLDEARLAARLNHPNVVQTYEVGNEGELYYMAMEFLDGPSYHRLVRRAAKEPGGLPLPVHLYVLTRALEGLHYAHELKDYDGTSLNVVHRDLSPHNVLVTYEGDCKIVDFGIAKAADSQVETRSGSFKGKVTYMPPEQVAGARVDRRADVFAAGVMLFEAVSGRRLWEKDPELVVAQRLAANDVPRLKDVAPQAPKALIEICDWALAPEVSARCPSALQMHTALDDYLRRAGLELSRLQLADQVARRFTADRERLRQTLEQQLKKMAAGEGANSDSARLPRASYGAGSHSGTGSLEELEGEGVRTRGDRPGGSSRKALVPAGGLGASERDEETSAPPGKAPERSAAPPGRPRVLYGGILAALALAAVGGAVLSVKLGRSGQEGAPGTAKATGPDAGAPANPAPPLESPHQGTAEGAASGRSIGLESPHQGTAEGAASGEPPAVEIVFASSDGKKEWVDDAVKSFNGKKLLVDGRRVVVKVQHMRSGESRRAILEGKEKPTIWGPAGRSWVDLINSEWSLREKKPFLTDVRDTVQTALIIATWEPMARALGWPKKPIGWADLQKVALNPKGWAAYGHPEWGAFRFGHAHPDYSNSAMLSFVSLIYAASGKAKGLTDADLKKPQVVAAVTALERAVVHYGESSSWIAEKLCTRGPAYLSAVTLYESSVVKANLKFPAKPFRLVALYPKEGTFWEAHPAGIVNADWVTPPQRQGARLFLDFLVSREVQVRAPQFGFRPALAEVPLSAPFDAEHGVDPGAERRELGYVDETLFTRANELWHQVKKKASVWVLLDTSDAMNGEPMKAAKRGCASFLKKMEPDDVVRLIAFGASVHPLGRSGKMAEVGDDLVSRVDGLFADGSSKLYDAIAAALREIEQARKQRGENRLYGIVVLTDGRDTGSEIRRSELIRLLPKREDTQGARVFTIGYGSEVDEELLREVSERSNGVMVKGGAADVERIYQQLAAYF